MAIFINQASDEPIYLQIRSQIIGAIAHGELAPGDRLPAVRQLASDLGINLHTVNKAYAVLRDEGYLQMKSRAGAVIAAEPPAANASESEQAIAHDRLSEQIRRLILEHKAAGGSKTDLMQLVETEVEAIYGPDSSK